MDDARIGIVGGSIGGLTAACLLRDSGHDVTVYERSPRPLEQRGAGIGLLSATSRYLTERANVHLDDISIATGNIRYLSRSGDVVHDQQQSYRFSSWNTVYRELMRVWPQERYLLDHEMVAFDGDADGAQVRFANGEHADVDLLVCADGVGSAGRAVLQPEATQHYAGYVAWRGMVPERDLEPALAERLGDAITYHVTANSHILVYPIPGIDGSVEPGERLINFVWYRNYLDGGDLDALMTDRNGDRRSLSLPPGMVAPEQEAEARATATARLPDPLAEVVEGCEDLFVQVVYDIEVQQMAFGRVCLLGDSAFSVRPHAAAGSAKAAADAWALAEALDDADSLGGALAKWETGRLALGAALLERTRVIGRRSQIDNTWTPGDPDFVFGLNHPGEP